MAQSLVIIIVNWQSGEQLRKCLASIPMAAERLPESAQLLAVVVVDNGSLDNSFEHLSCGEIQVVLVKNQSNRGFAAACNQGAAIASSIAACSQMLFLNPDTTLFTDS